MENLKMLLNLFGKFCFSATLWYVIFAFISWKINIAEWHSVVRLFYFILFISTFFNSIK